MQPPWQPPDDDFQTFDLKDVGPSQRLTDGQMRLYRKPAPVPPWMQDHLRAASWLGRELADEGLPCYVVTPTNFEGGSRDGGWGLSIGADLVVVAKYCPTLDFESPTSFRWDTISFEMVEVLDDLRARKNLPQAYVMVSKGFNGYAFVMLDGYAKGGKDAKYMKKIRRRIDHTDGASVLMEMAEVPTDTALGLDDFIPRARGFLGGRSDDTLSPMIWTPVKALPFPDLPAPLHGGGFRKDDPRAGIGTCIACGRPKPPGRPAYCRLCGKVAKAYSARQANPEKVARPQPARRQTGRMEWESEASLLDLIDEAMERKPRYGPKRNDGSGRYRDVAYDDENMWDR